MEEPQVQQQQQQMRSATYIGVHERTPEMRTLYASSSIRQALLFEPEEAIGGSPLDRVSDSRDIEELRNHHDSVTDDNIILTKCFINNKLGQPVFLRAIAFVCSNINFYVATTFPHITPDQGVSLCSVERFKYDISGSENDAESIDRRRRGADMNAMYSMRTTNQACFILEGLSENNLDPKIKFVTDSINRILDVDSSDLQGVFFLTLVDIEDETKATAFLEKLLDGNELVFERLQILESPLEGNFLEEPRSVVLELMAMGSDNGAIMLCQLERSSISQLDDRSRYMALEDIISSDPETSDFPDDWSRVAAANTSIDSLIKAKLKPGAIYAADTRLLRTRSEKRIVEMSSAIRDKSQWFEKMNDQEIRQRWTNEAKAQSLTDKEIAYVFDELAYYASLRVPGSGVELSG
ncbi:hypothetical protein GGI12_002723, partial [Dipsacomyces acuminosporus]